MIGKTLLIRCRSGEKGCGRARGKQLRRPMGSQAWTAILLGILVESLVRSRSFISNFDFMFDVCRSERHIPSSAEKRTRMHFGHLSIRFSLVCGIGFFVLLNHFSPTRAQSVGLATLIVKVTGLRSQKGQVRIAVFNSPESWLGDHPAYNATIDVDGQSLTWRLNDIPYGDYGIAVLHDENKNGKMDNNVLGMPKEPYGFSNNLRVTFRAPKWDRGKFAVRNPTTEISIEVK